MGYTHYFPQLQVPEPAQWQALTAAVMEAFSHLPTHSHSAGGYYADQPLRLCGGAGDYLLTQGKQLIAPNTGSRALVFNGDDEAGLAHETFYLPGYPSRGSDFCKTARKPYDWFVVACLVLADKHCPGCYDIRSDGKETDWKPVMEWLEAIGLGPVSLPVGVDSER